MNYDIQIMLKHRRIIGMGIDRVAFFCPEHSVVIKRSLRFEFGEESVQSQREFALFTHLTEEEKKCFAFIDFVQYTNIIHIIMKRVSIINEIFHDDFSSWELFDDRRIIEMCADYGYYNIHYEEFTATMEKYRISDLHGANVGLDETGRLVIIDAGLAYS